MQQQELIPHLFRTEYSKICAVLSRSFGIDYLEVAEDIASETFVLALETWSYKGIPQNPVAWLYVVAKNKAKNYVQRNALFSTKIANEIKGTTTDYSCIDLSEENIAD